MFPRARTVMTIGGIDVRLSSSWIVIALLIVWSFQSRWAGPFGEGPALAMATAGAVLFFLSLLAHELGHALEAHHRGIGVEGITLFLLGGVTEMTADAERPRDEFAIAAVGPFVSLVLGAIFGILATIVDLTWNVTEVENVFGLLGWLNVGLAIFNMVPASPLDGGRVLRAAIWAAFGDRRMAIVGSARAGQLFALLVAGLAARDLVVNDPRGAAVNLMVAWFLWTASQAELRHVALDRLLDGERAGALEIEPAPPVDAGTSLALVANGLDASSAKGARPVATDGQIVGVLDLREVWSLHPQDQTFRVAGDVMLGADAVPRIASNTPVRDLLETFRVNPLVLLDLDDGQTTTMTSGQFGEALERLRQRRRGTRPVELAVPPAAP